MDFFAGQDRARRRTRWLILLFLAACLGLIAATYAFVTLALFLNDPARSPFTFGDGRWVELVWIAGIISGGVSLVAVVRWVQMSAGGGAIAEMMGALRVQANADEARLAQYHNVVEEIALAANMPVPGVYFLPGERGMNAFAAGISPADSVVCVTEGLLDHLNRNELQAVVAHEFSHILQGDTRLNIRLAAMIKGITFIGDVGRMLLYSGRSRRHAKSEQRVAVSLLGLGLLVLGSAGTFFASLIQSAISRQREYFADASAVQFTRNGDAVADALKVVAGYLPSSHVAIPQASDFAHAFFGSVKPHFWGWMSTHPPIEARILRIQPRWDGRVIERRMIHYESPKTGADTPVKARIAAAAILAGANPEGLFSAEPMISHASNVDADSERDPQHELSMALQEPLVALAHVVALFLSTESTVRSQQGSTIAASGIAGLESAVAQVDIDRLAYFSVSRLQLVELSCAALRALSYAQYQSFKVLVLDLIRADRRIELKEWVLYHLLRRYLDSEFLRVPDRKPKYRRLEKVREPCRVALSLLCHHGSGDSINAFELAWGDLGLAPADLLPLELCSVSEFSKSIETLALCYPLLKPRILKAMQRAAFADQEVNEIEREIIYAVAAIMDCPLPSAIKLD